MLKQLLNSGISEEYEESLKRRIKLANFIAIFALVVSVPNIPVYIYFKMWLIVFTSLCVVGICALSIFLQSKKKHVLGFGTLIFSMTLLLDIMSLQFGLSTNFHFFHLCTCMTALILLTNHVTLRNFTITVALGSFFFMLFYLQNKPGLVTVTDEVARVLKYYGYFNYFTIFMFSIMFFSSFVKQNALFQDKLSLQNVILEHRNKQIVDSIEYAKYIQDAILPPMNTVKTHLEESFVFYKPKDIVAGDFYWIDPQPDGSVLFAAADATGHGVPGAMVSVVCTNALNLAVKEFKLADPGLILNKTREIITDCFQKPGTNVMDGMDISLCHISADKRTLKWAGANNPLWLINNTGEITEIKANKQPVGRTSNPQPFKTHILNLEKGDCFYLFTDGYADQFGGEKAKKYMQKRLKEFLLSIYKKPMELQRELIAHNIEKWKGNLEQVDDICFAGVRI
ncbi:MAG: SpoIIE family protein phosphatase [Bacteroidia bacterium]|nr:SpoIIE family protein phosphatase [Bacteroidia bacterium]